MDVPFEYQEHPVHPRLADLAEVVWTARGTISYGRERILPTPKPVLIVNLGSPFVVRASKAPPRDGVMRGGWLVGPQTGYVENQPLAETNVVGVTLKPWGAAALFDVSAHELRDRIVDLDALMGAELDRLRDQLAGTSSTTTRRAIIIDALVARRDAGPPSVIHTAVRGLASGSPQSVGSTTHELHISRKHLNHLFARYVGLTPRDIARLHRFNRTLRALGSSQLSALVTVAHDNGYYDQSHMNRDFIAFSDINPSEYLRRRAAHLSAGIDDAGLFVPGM